MKNLLYREPIMILTKGLLFKKRNIHYYGTLFNAQFIKLIL